jgi:hypothetical protein
MLKRLTDPLRRVVRFIIFLLPILVALNIADAEQHTSSLEQQQVAIIVSELARCPSWILFCNRDASTRAHIVHVYERLNSYESSVLRKGIAEYWRTYCSARGSHPEGAFGMDGQAKVFALIRVLFVVPAHYRYEDGMSRGFFVSADEPDNSPDIWLSWPIENGPDGVPRLIGMLSSKTFEGPDYNGLRDFDFISSHFHRRPYRALQQ